MTALNHAVAVAMARGPAPALALVDELAEDKRLTDHHRLHAVRGHLLEMSGTYRARWPPTDWRPSSPGPCRNSAT